MRCAVCDEPFHRADGYQSPRGLVCSASCVEEVEDTSQSPRMRQAAMECHTTREGELRGRLRGRDE